MSTEIPTRKLRFAASMLSWAILAFTIFWIADVVSYTSAIVFGDAMGTFAIVEPWVTPTITMRVLFGVLWFGVGLIGLLASFFAWRFLRRIRAGHYFSSRTARDMQYFGLSLAAVMIWDTVIAAFMRPVLTMQNRPFDAAVEGSVGYIAPSYVYDAGDITALFCGLAFFVVGWLLKEGGRIEDEFKAII